MPKEALDKLNKALQVSQIITGSFISAQVLLVVFSYIVSEGNTTPDEIALPVAAGLSVAALGAAGAAVFMRWKLLGGLAIGLLVSEDLRPADPAPDAEVAEALDQLPGRFQSGHIVSLALAEICATLGFGLAHLSGAWTPILPFVLVGIVLTALFFPTRSGVLSLLSPEVRAAVPGR